MTDLKEYYVRLAIIVRIPMAFKKFCDESYTLKKIPFKTESGLSSEDQKINYFFEIHKNGQMMASFSPDGNHECYLESFKSIFKKIVDDINYAAYKAAKAQDKISKDIIEKMDSEFNFDD